jgi:hypothetical protein
MFFFYKFKKDKSIINHRTKAIFEVYLHFLVKYLHMLIQTYTYINTTVIVKKLKISFFQRSREITLSKIIEP